MKEINDSEQTPLPGKRVTDDTAKSLVATFYATFQITRRDIPAACTLVGDRNPFVLCSRAFRQQKALHVLFRVLSAAVCSPILPWKTRPGHRPPQLREAASAAAVA
jgi:hypothetical protein